MKLEVASPQDGDNCHQKCYKNTQNDKKTIFHHYNFIISQL